MRGMVRKRGNRWQALIKVRDPITGDWKQISATKATKADADEWANETSARYGAVGGDARNTTVGELLDAWWPIVAPDWSPSTRRNNASIVDAHIRPRWGDVKLRKLRPADFDAWMAELRVGRSASTVVRIFGVFRLALEQAVRWEWINSNPALKARPPRQTRSSINAPELVQLVTLLEMAKERDPDMGAFLHLAVATGARRGELCAIRWSSLDLDAGRVTISHAVVMGPGDLPVIKGTKTGGVRTVSLDPLTVSVLKEQRIRCIERAMTCRGSITPESFVFSLDADGEHPWRGDYVTSNFVRLCKRAEITGVRLHDLRHYHATRLLTSGVDLSTVAGRLGHSGGRTTLAVYAHFLDAADRGAADIIGADLARVRKAQ